jgi:hypothetical protein
VTRSEAVRVAPAAVPTDKYRAALLVKLEGSLGAGETIVAVLPFVSTPKRPRPPGAPRGRKGKVRTGIYQSWRRYRPLVLTDRRLFVFDTGRTPNPRQLLAVFARSDVDVISVQRKGRATRFVLELPGAGPVPFEAGRREWRDTAVLVEWLGADIT